MTSITRSNYETLLYTLAERFSNIQTATTRLYSDSRTTAIVRGSVFFKNGLELRIFEYLDLSDGEILEYSYSIYDGEQKIRWYDPQPHPENEALAVTFPHHFHEEPDIKHNRKPAHGISFNAPNLPTLIDICSQLK